MTIDKQNLNRFLRSLLVAFLIVAPGGPLAAHEDKQHDRLALAEDPAWRRGRSPRCWRGWATIACLT